MAVLEALPIEHAGAFFAGAVAPDVDKLLGYARATTHWWQVGNDVSGALRLCASRPRLVHLPRRSQDQAFVAGYLCHLVTDEQWTILIYRKHFGRNSRFAGSRDGADHQLALQGVLDTELVVTGSLHPAVRALTALGRTSDLARVVLSDNADAVDRFVRSVLARANEADPVMRLRIMASAREGERAKITEAIGPPIAGVTPFLRTTDDRDSLDAFAQQLPTLREAATNLVPRPEIHTFRNRAISASRVLLGEYLRGEAMSPPPGTSAAPYFGSPARTDL